MCSSDLVVFESDDWGSIRTPSKKVYESLAKEGLMVHRCPFAKYDSLASVDDLTALFDTLLRHKDSDGRHPVFTANTVVANPDFQKIKDSNFNSYHYEPFIETLKRYPNHSNSFKFWNEGLQFGIFHPQLHGREHLNVSRWMKNLQEGSHETRIAFSHEMFGISTNISKEKRRSYMSSLDYDDYDELNRQKAILFEAQDLFYKLFGYTSESFIAANYTWGFEHERVLNSLGIKYLQGSRSQVFPIGEHGRRRYKIHYIGERSKSDQYYLVRNCYFEPSLDHRKDSVSECLKQIDTAFLWRKPAIIGSHRFNYIGFLEEKNRENSLKKLDELLKKVITRGPDVEFLTSDALGRLIFQNLNHD